MYKVMRRRFTALRFEKGSFERNRLNKSSITSEFARHKKWVVLNNDKPIITFETPNQCYDFINTPNKEVYKSKDILKRYTRKMFINTQNFFSNKKRYLKNSM